jgi:hypothetical protein
LDFHKLFLEKLKKNFFKFFSLLADWNEALFITPLDTHLDNFIFDYSFKKLYKKMHAGDLDTFTYLVPRQIDIPDLGVYAWT